MSTLTVVEIHQVIRQHHVLTLTYAIASYKCHLVSSYLLQLVATIES